MYRTLHLPICRAFVYIVHLYQQFSLVNIKCNMLSAHHILGYYSVLPQVFILVHKAWEKKKRCLFALFRPTQKFGKLGFFLFCFVLIFNFAFLNKIVKIKVSKHIVTVPKVYCVGTKGICLPHTCLHQIVWCHLLNTENYICISVTSRF